MRPPLVAVTVAVAAGAVLLTGCGSTTTPATPSAAESAGESSGASPTVPAGVFPVVIARTGGIAGFSDRVTVQADGSAQASTRRGPGAPCRLTAGALTRLEQAVTLLAAAPAPPSTTSARVSDELVTTVQTPAARGAVRLDDAPKGAATVVGELLAELTQDPGSRTLCPPG